MSMYGAALVMAAWSAIPRPYSFQISHTQHKGRRRMSRIWAFPAFLVAYLCCSSLLPNPIAAAQEDSITDPIEVTALQAIRETLIDPFNHLRNWNQGDPCTSNWTGVLCFNTTRNDGYLHVLGLQLLNMNLSGTLSPELGHFSYMTILDFMWNTMTGSIPKEIGNISSLELLLLNGNKLTGSLPEEIGYLPNLDRIQIDENQISGPLPKSFANLNKTKHFHMNNNSISGQIPPELSRLPSLVHLLLDNNNLSGYLPPEFSAMPNLLILQLDNNNFDGGTIPASYVGMSKLLKLSLRNCSLLGPIPDLSRIPNLGYLDLSSNQLNGSIPPDKLSDDITTIILSNNNLTGTIPVNFSGLPRLQKLSLANNSLSGSVSSSIWLDRTLNATESYIVDLQNNRLSNVSGSFYLPANVTIRLQGNPLCSSASLFQLCGSQNQVDENTNQVQGSINSTNNCAKCPAYFEHAPESNVSCFCAAPLLVQYRLKSPGFSNFLPYQDPFKKYLTSGLHLHTYQLYIDSIEWQKGPRLKMFLKLYPVYDDHINNSNIFNGSEVLRIRSILTGWIIQCSPVFGPNELLSFTLSDPYKDDAASSTSGISKGALAGIILGSIAGAVTLSALVSLLISRRRLREHHVASKLRQYSKINIKIDGVKEFTYGEMALATNNFNSFAQIGQGGYGKVYKGILTDGIVVAIKRAQEGSLQGEKEFLTEIELLSRVHHRNLVSLIGYCDEEGEQMLVYEFMSNGTLRDHLSAKSKEPLGFAMRLRIALGSSKSILYLHTEADPPIFHRDIKASNILLDSKFTPKVADFGLSRLAPVPDIEGTLPAPISTVVKGTPGYLDPEYFLTHQLTDKSDVYSLGVVFLELLTGMHPISHGKNIVREDLTLQNLVEEPHDSVVIRNDSTDIVMDYTSEFTTNEVNVAYQSGMIFSVIDGKMGSYPSKCVERFMTLALKCCQDETDARPSMKEVVRELENIWHMMPGSDTRTTDTFSVNDPGKDISSQPSSSSTMKNTYVSGDVSGSDLDSGVFPTITPR